MEETQPFEDKLYINWKYRREQEDKAREFREDLKMRWPVFREWNGEQAWVVYSNHPKRAQAAAFSSQILADLVHEYIEGSEPPQLLPSSNIEVKVDEYRELVLDKKRPFTVLMEDGEIFEVLGYASVHECDVASIDSPEFSRKDGRHTMSGTFWAWDTIHAAEAALTHWKEHAK